MALAALALIAMVALAACGGGGDTAATPAATQAPADSGTTVDDTPPAQPSSTSGTEDLFILSRRFQSLELTLTAGDNVSVTYDSVGATTGGPGNLSGEGKVTAEVKLTIVDPVEEQIIVVDNMQTNTLEFQAELSGLYQLVFENPYLLQALSVNVDYTIN